MADEHSQATLVVESERQPGPSAGAEVSVLVIAWCPSEPHRIGEISVLADGGARAVLGRGASGDGMEPRVRFFRQRPGSIVETGPLLAPGLSRRQLSIAPRDGGAHVERVGQCPMEVNGVRTDVATIRPGDVVHLRRELVLLCVRRPGIIAPLRLFPKADLGEFGEPDRGGIVGESPCMWKLREKLAFAAKSETHTLLVGESGTGKELAARAIHRLSARASQPFVARNAATLPPGLIDAELFGNAKNYPNAGMPERAGLIGEADGGTLFLDEIGELPIELQAHLLRVLDGDGEYQRLGEATVRRSSFRLVGATNRDPKTLKHDFAARFTARVELPSLAERREDVALVARQLLLRAASKSADVVGPFIGRTESGYEYPRVEPALLQALLRHTFTTHMRELDQLLWRAMAESTGDVIVAPPELRMEPPSDDRRSVESRPEPSERDPTQVSSSRPEPTADEIRAALHGQGGKVAAAARALGLSSRYALYRLMKKHGIEVVDADDEPGA